MLELLELDEEEWMFYLDRRGITGDIRDEVVSLLSFSASSDGFLESPAVVLASKNLIDENEAELNSNGTTIGQYTIEREIGSGGMGAVYLAHRSDGKFAQKVAIKLLRREFNSVGLREAFRREIDIQSRLEHPNIARILDTGTTDEGIPYIALEYVDGEAIDEYCFRKGLAFRDRLKLFNKACEGVGTAHQNLIIHRDIKASNILVTADGTPKLIDFGISKLISADGSVDSSPTLFTAMTPHYASPEQISGKPVSTLTDIYSLAVVLYRLLTGEFPFALNGADESERRRIICETEPPLASQMTGPKGVAADLLAGDIDNILAKALQKDPADRYRTVEQFADDIWRSMDGLPVRARPSTWTYRATKFIRRNRIGVSAAAAVLITLLTGISIATWQSRVARAESENARNEQAKSEKMAKYMAKIIGYANPGWYAEGAKQKGEARVIDALNELADRIDADFPDDIDIAAELHYRFAEVFGWVVRNKPEGPEKDGYREKSKNHHLRALELRTRYYGEWHALVAKDLYYSYTLLSEDPYEQCRLFDRAINMMRSTDATNRNFPFMLTDYAAIISYLDDHPRTVPCGQTVTPQTNESSHEIAIRYYREAMPYLKMHFPAGGNMMAYADCRLAVSLARQGLKDEALPLRSKCQAFVNSTPEEADRRQRLIDLEKLDAILATPPR